MLFCPVRRAKIGKDGEPFQLFTKERQYKDSYKIKSNDKVYIAINDSYYGDNRGEHRVNVKGSNICFDCSTQESSTMKKNDSPLEHFDLNFDLYCKSKFGSSATTTYTEGDAYSWRCSVEDLSGRKQYLRMDINLACEMQYGNDFKAIVGNLKEQYSWYCIRK